MMMLNLIKYHSSQVQYSNVHTEYHHIVGRLVSNHAKRFFNNSRPYLPISIIGWFCLLDFQQTAIVSNIDANSSVIRTEMIIF